MKFILITGTSRGIGAALAEQLLDETHHIVSLSRTGNEELAEAARLRNCKLSYYPCDLQDLNALPSLMSTIFEHIAAEGHVDALYLINNAGMLSPVAPIEHCDTAEMIANVNLNLLAPMILTSSFIKEAAPYELDKRILNVSSASAKYLMPAQSCYSTGKAGLDSFSRSVSIEQSGKPNPVKIVSVYPGMIDTQLQAEIRAVSKEVFPYVDQFRQLAEEGKLQTPAYTAQKLIELLLQEEFGSTVVVEQLPA